MKIYILGIDKILQPRHQEFAYPQHNKDYGVEQDFLAFLMTHRSLLASSREESDWHYLPVYWTRWHLNHDYGRNCIEELQRYVDDVVIDDSRTFTVCQYDDGPLVNIGQTVQFLASRKTERGFDIPLLCNHHRMPFFKPKKKYLASFAGRLSTHLLREEMAAVLKERKDVIVHNGNISTRDYVKMVLQSRLALAPRGYGGSSFRLFEAMQLGVAPVMIGDLDTRPFMQFLPWQEVSIFVNNMAELNAALDKNNEDELIKMGIRAAELYKNHLTYQKWCPYVIKVLQEAV
jgi:hypothetical protein